MSDKTDIGNEKSTARQTVSECSASLGLKIYSDPLPHIKWDDIKNKLTPEQHDNFRQFMTGQTCIAEGCYVCDFERWVRQGMKNKQGFDWD